MGGNNVKKATLQISFDSEKLGALKLYMDKKDVSLVAELNTAMNKFYEKHVPAPVREYIQNRLEEAEAKSKRPSKSGSKENVRAQS